MTHDSSQMRSEADGLAIHLHAWLAPAAARGSVVIAHGAAEHALRYGRFAAVLNDAGLSVWAPDHRGHGRSRGPGGLGDFESAGWDGLVSDLAQTIGRARAALPGAPLALFGHSMGSFAAQDLCARGLADLDALVLSGSTAITKPPPGERQWPNFNAPFEPARTPYDWLSRDEAEVDAYIADPLCGFERRSGRPGTNRPDFAQLAREDLFAGVRADLPVLLLSGDQDPIHRGLSGLRLLEQRLRAGGLERVDTRCYAGGRHEMLNETNRDQVMADARDWLLDALGLPSSE